MCIEQYRPHGDPNAKHVHMYLHMRQTHKYHDNFTLKKKDTKCAAKHTLKKPYLYAKGDTNIRRYTFFLSI